MNQKILDWLRQWRTRAPQGPPPSAEEFVQLSEGTLPTARRREIMSHLASDQALLHQWVQLQQELDSLPDGPLPSPKTIRYRTWHMTLGGTMAAAVLVLAVFVLPSRQIDSLMQLDALGWPEHIDSQHWVLGSKGPASQQATSRSEQQAFSAGVSLALAKAPADSATWQQLREIYLKQSKGVQCPDDCSDAQQIAWQAGYWAGSARLMCLATPAPSKETLDTFNETRTLLSIPDTLESLAVPTENIATLCKQAGQLFDYYGQ